MGEWKGSPRKQIIQKLVELFKESPTSGLDTLVRRKTGTSGINKRLFQGVEAIDEGGVYLQGVNKTKKGLSKQLQSMESMSKLINLRKQLGTDDMAEEANKIRKLKDSFKQQLQDIKKRKADVRADVQTVIEDIGGSGEVRRQRRELENAVRVMQQKRPFDN